MMELKKYRLGKCLTFIENGAVIKQFKDGKGIPITRIETLSNNSFNRDKLGYANIFNLKEYAHYILDDKDLLMSHINSRSFLGRTVLYRKRLNEHIIHGMNLLRLKTNEHILDPLYAYYFFQTKYFKKCIDTIRKDAINQSSIAISDIKNIIIHIPDIERQKHIVRVLQSLDQKIDINRQINDNLEKMAKQLYDYWFVQFDFPDENGRPYKSSGGAMVWNEKLKREIPLNWIVLSVNNIASSIRGVSYAKEDMVDSNLGVLVLRGNNIQDNHLIYDNNAAYIPKTFVSEEQHIQPLDIIMTMSSGSKEHIGKCAMFQFASKDTFGAFLTKFTAKAHYAYLLFNLFNSQYFKEKIKSIACGTGINNLTNQTFDEIYMAVPQDNVLLEFDKRQSQIFSEIGLFEENNLKLTKLRDELLPLLMNGQVSLNYHLSDD